MQIEFDDDKQLLTFAHLKNFLQIFGYITREDESLAGKAWKAVKADEKKGFSKRDLRFLLCGIHNIWLPEWMAGKGSSEKSFIIESEQDFHKFH